MQDNSNRFSLRTDGAAHLRILLERRDDRFQQSICFVSPDDRIEATELLTSVDGAAGSAWPESPPIQACQIEPNVGILGTGMAGTTHWSLAITAATNELVWDVACRYKKLPARLSSSYATPIDFRAPLSAKKTPLEQAMLVATLPGGYTTRLSIGQQPATRSQLDARPESLAIRPAEVLAPPVTSRWLYRLTLVPPSLVPA